MVSRSAALRSGSQTSGEKSLDLVDDRTMRDYLAVGNKYGGRHLLTVHFRTQRSSRNLLHPWFNSTSPFSEKPQQREAIRPALLINQQLGSRRDICRDMTTIRKVRMISGRERFESLAYSIMLLYWYRMNRLSYQVPHRWTRATLHRNDTRSLDLVLDLKCSRAYPITLALSFV